MKAMNTKLIIGTMAAFLAPLVAHAISFDIHNVSGTSQPTSANLHFLGDTTFTFDDATTGVGSGHDFIVNSTSGAGDAFGLYGNISGTFTVGPSSGGAIESATVTSSPGATLSIFDGVNTFSGLINWITLVRDDTSGNLNIAGAVNLTGITYSGTVADLIALKGANNSASSVINFTFNPALSINDLRTQNVKTSYSGDITSVPDAGGTVMLLGLALSGIALVRNRIRA